jgi:hypothetical protein
MPLTRKAAMSNPIRKLIQRERQAVISLLLAATLTLTAQAQDTTPPPQTVRVKRGQVLAFSLLTRLDSGQAQKGDDVSLSLMRPLVTDGKSVLPAGWTAHSKIKKGVRAGKKCKSGRIDWRLSRLDAPGKKKVKLIPISKYEAEHDGQLVDWIDLDSAAHKRSNSDLQWLVATPFVVIFLPLIVLFVISLAMGNDCDGSPGHEASIAAGAEFYFAIGNDADVVSQ